MGSEPGVLSNEHGPRHEADRSEVDAADAVARTAASETLADGERTVAGVRDEAENTKVGASTRGTSPWWAVGVALLGVIATTVSIVVTHSDTAPRTATEDEIREYAADRWADVEPDGPGPWRMLVVAGSEVPDPSGLKVRSSPDQDGHQIGSVVDRGYVWARCRTDSGFNPLPNVRSDYGSTWFAITWPSDQPGSAFRSPDVNDPYLGYVWSGAVVSQGQNDHFPSC